MWILPGTVYRLCSSLFRLKEDDEKENWIVIKIIMITFVFRLLVDLIVEWFPNWQLSNNTIYANALTILLSALFGFFFGWLATRECVAKLYAKTTHLSMDELPWFAMADKEKGCHVRVYLHNEEVVYYGEYRRFYFKGGTIWIVIANYSIEGNFNANYEQTIKEQKDLHAEYAMVINEKEIKRVEFLYAKDSKVLEY